MGGSRKHNGSRKRSLSRSSSISTQSDLSFCSTLDSFDVHSTSEDISVKHRSAMNGGATWPLHMMCSPCEPVDQACSDDSLPVRDDSTGDNTSAHSGAWAKLKSEAPVFQPMATD